MKQPGYRLLGTIVLMVIGLVLPAFAQEPDVEGSKDHPLLSRMPGYRINQYEQKDFESHKFDTPTGTGGAVEGKKTFIEYVSINEEKFPSALAIARNVQAALTKLGAKVIYENHFPISSQIVMRLAKGGAELWVEVYAIDNGLKYRLTIVEKGEMKQEVTADAAAWRGEIKQAGRVVLYGILFDTDKAVIKPESEPVLAEIAKMLKAEPSLNLFVVGHTDKVGDLDHNLKLSQERAAAVTAALTSRFGIAANRLSAHGVGPLAPVASNADEAGRTKNRRVELVQR